MNKIKIAVLIWAVVLFGTAFSHFLTAIANGYFANGLLGCALSNYLADAHWNTTLFTALLLIAFVLTLLLRLVISDARKCFSISLRVLLFAILGLVTAVFLNTSAWFPEFYTSTGILYNVISVLCVAAFCVFIPIPLKWIDSALGRVWFSIPLLLVLFLYVLPAVYWGVVREEHDRNVLFITVDTLRSGGLSINGNHRKTSENIDAFANQCLNFKRAYSQSSFTPPSHASMFTSRYVSNHKLFAWDTLDNAIVTMAEVFANDGFNTAAFTNMSMLSEQNLGQGFQTKVESFLNVRNCLSERISYKLKKRAVDFFSGFEINEMFLDWLKKRKGTPFFVWLHYWDVHRPYAQDPRYELVFSDSTQSSRRVGRDNGHYNLRDADIRNYGFSKDDLKFICDRYDASVYTFDLIFRELIQGLKDLGVYDQTMIVLTGDHGESLMEREEMYFTHDPFLYNEVINVPLIIKIPGKSLSASLDKPVMLVDLFPTILKTLGMHEKYEIESDGRTLDLGSDPVPDSEDREIVSECFGWRQKRAVIIDEVKYIYDFQKDIYEAYDLDIDLLESKNIFDDRLTVDIDSVMSTFNNDISVAAGAREMDADQYERLKALGYIDQ